MTNKKGYIKCQKCGEIYNVVPEDLEKEDLRYKCDKCGSNIDVFFFAHCSICKEDVGMSYSPQPFISVAKDLLKGATNPILGVKAIAHLLDRSAPYDHGEGVCQFCGTKFVRCPNCHSAVDFDPTTKFEDMIFCPECGQKFRYNH